VKDSHTLFIIYIYIYDFIYYDIISFNILISLLLCLMQALKILLYLKKKK
jgi:hypothetical protein